MARLESQAIGGYYPTPEHLVPRIAALVHWPLSGCLDLVDPCAGDGAAIVAFGKLRKGCTVHAYTCEMEATRYTSLRSNLNRNLGWNAEHSALKGDAFCVRATRAAGSGADVLYLNPPYDTDPLAGRLEQAFLQRFFDVLRDNGLLFFLVPHGALKASADLLATEFDLVQVYRFPTEDFAAYKQVVLVARRRQGVLSQPHTTTARWLRQVAQDPTSLPTLPELDQCGPYPALTLASPLNHGRRLAHWAMQALDAQALLAAVQPWHETAKRGVLRPIEVVEPAGEVATALRRKYPIAVPPRPAHLAAGIAAGIYNGTLVQPNNPAAFPSLLIKGVFDREWRKLDERTNSDGDVTQVVEIQQPKLRTTIFRCDTGEYLTLKDGVVLAETDNLADFSNADLLQHYGVDLLRVLREQCPPLWDGTRVNDLFPLLPTARKLFPAQENTVRAIVKLFGGPGVTARALENRVREQPALLGEMGTGKTTVALAVTHQLKARRVLVLCPPHLLDTWTEETEAVLPEAQVRLLRNVADVDALWAERHAPGVRIAVMSREVAKLGHAWGSVPFGPGCPSCGAALVPGDYAKKRARCEAVSRRPGNAFAKLAERVGVKLVRMLPLLPVLEELMTSRVLQKYRARLCRQAEAGELTQEMIHAGWVCLKNDHFLLDLIEKRLFTALDAEDQETRTRAFQGLLFLALGCENLGRACRIARAAYQIAGKYPNNYSSRGTEALDLCQYLLFLLPPDYAWYAERFVQAPFSDEVDITAGWATYEKFDPHWGAWARKRDALRGGTSTGYDQEAWRWREIEPVAGSPLARWNGFSWGSVAAFQELLVKLIQLGKWVVGQPCNTPLFQALPDPEKVSESTCAPEGAGQRADQPSPVRVALAKFICKRYPDLFDFLILDECHEYSSESSAQQKAAHRLMGLRKPTLIMTGTLNNGYAESFFSNMHAISAKFGEEFTRDDRQKFVNRYGYRKRVLEDREDGKVVAFGSVSDRVQRSVRVTGNGPGVLPLFLPAHLLRVVVTLHKTDLDLDLPPFQEIPVKVAPSSRLREQYLQLRSQLVAQIKRDMFTPMAGKLWGALAELPSYLDRASYGVGNTEAGVYRICYPQNVGGGLVAEAQPLPAESILEKEHWLVETLRAELAEGHNVMVFGWHLNLFPRLARIIEQQLQVKPTILWADKVPTGKRKAWIDREVVKKRARVLIVNPVAVQTGLNNLTWFSSVIWAENPACNPVFYRQANGRIHRIGQLAKEIRAYFPLYEGTSQELMHRLLLHKVGVSLATDGLDPESALIAAGAAEGGTLDSLALGKQLFELLQREQKAVAA